MKKTLISIILLGLLGVSAPTAQDTVSIGRAEAIILQMFPEATVIAIQRIQQGEALVWEARLEDDTLIYIDLRSGDILDIVKATPAIAPAPAVATSEARPSRPSPVPVRGLPAISFDRALEIALAEFPDAELVAAGLERGQWDISLSNGIAVYINARTGRIVQLEPWEGDRAPIDVPIISFEEALSIAQAFYPRRNFVTVELEQSGRREGFTLVWKIEFGRGQEIYVDAMTGEVLRR
jgi:uncharacterized membrane protein YkoI